MNHQLTKPYVNLGVIGARRPKPRRFVWFWLISFKDEQEFTILKGSSALPLTQLIEHYPFSLALQVGKALYLWPQM